MGKSEESSFHAGQAAAAERDGRFTMERGAPRPGPIVAAGERVLLLQGPMGPFFRRFAAWLRVQGAVVWKINFNGGDRLFYRGADAMDFRDGPEAWPAYLRGFLLQHGIGRVFLFGDCRRYHRLAIAVCRSLGVPVMVFEEGYLRPDYVTLEEGGVNGFSSLPRDPAFYLARPELPEPGREPAHGSFFRMAVNASLYYWAGYFMTRRYGRYEHHKCFSPVRKGLGWMLGGLRKAMYWRRDRFITRWLGEHFSGRYFLVPLQVKNDSQVRVHSSYGDVHGFIMDVMRSFAGHAPEDVLLVFKHHPMDRGFAHYREFIAEWATALGIARRVVYAHELHLPACLDHARGVVVINSTVGLSALLHNVPVKTLGTAFYDMEGLTCQRPLDEFWRDPGRVSEELHRKFRHYLIETTQLNGSFHGRFPLPDGVTVRVEPTCRAAGFNGAAVARPEPAR